jgi:DeoR/GlpR family transcriptional regulator of sugar metabolism
LGQIKADLCLLGTNSIHPNFGISDLEWEIIEVKKAMIGCAQKIVSLAISKKLNSIQQLQVCEIEKIDLLITELDPENQLLLPYLEKGLTVL